MQEVENVTKKEKTGKVYLIVSPTGRKYVGSTGTPVQQRWSKYKGRGEGCKDQRRLHYSLRKYGWDTHIKEVIWEGAFELMFRMEHLLGLEHNVLHQRKGMNCTLPGYDDVPALVSDFTKKKISNSNRGRVLPAKTKQQRVNMGKSKVGKKMPEEISKLFKRVSLQRKRPVLIYDLSWTLILEVESVIAGAKFCSGCSSEVSKSCRDGKTTVKGYRFKFKLDYSQDESVKQINPFTNKIIKTWDSITEAATVLDITSYGIKSSATKRINTSGGFKWEFVDPNFNTSYDPKKYRKTDKPKKVRDRSVIDAITEKNKRPINIYSIEGKYLKTFSSVKEASEHFKCQSNVVIKACKSVNPTLRGFQLRHQITNDTDDIKPYVKISKGCIKVNQIDQTTGDLIKTWNSVKEAANSVGSETSAMSRACKKGHNCKGFKWQYA